MIAGLLSLVSCALVTLTSGITVSPIVRQKYYTTTTKVPQMIAYFQPSPQIRAKNADSVSSAAIFGRDVIKIVQPPDNVRGKEFIRGGSRSDLKNRVKLSPQFEFANPGLKSIPIQIDPRQQNYQLQKDFFSRSPNIREYPKVKPSVGFDVNPVVNQLNVLRMKHRDLFAEEEGVPQFDSKKTQRLQKPPLGYEIFAQEKENFRKNISPTRKRKEPQRQRLEEKNHTTSQEAPTRFVPTRLYAQVRHSSTQKHRPRQLEEPRARERLQTKKTHVVYSEDGYEDSKYDHGDEEKFAEHKERRVKRNTEVAEAEELPVALALIGSANLTGEEVLEYLEEVIRNSSKYLPDDHDDDRFSFTSHLLNKTEIEKLFALPVPDTMESESRQSNHKDKYPFYFLPSTENLPHSSALRYAETPKTLPRKGETFYATKKRKICEEIDQDVDPTETMDKKRRLNNLGDKIDCFRENFFGEDPLDNPIFHEEFVDAQETTTVSISTDQIETLTQQKTNQNRNPGINVYDDVISNIRAAVVADTLSRHARTRQAYLNIPKVESQPEKVKLERPRDVVRSNDKKIIQNYMNHNGFVFDISKYFPPLYVVQPESGKIYRIHPQQRIVKSKKKLNKSKGKRVSHKTKDYTVFPTIGTSTPNTVRPQLIVHPIMSSGNYPYMALKKNKNRNFHYEGLIFH